MKRYFFVDKTAKVGEFITIEGQEHIHISKVLRLSIGDEIVCLPNDESALNASITEINKKTTTIKVESIEHPQQETSTHLTVYVAMPKGDKFEFLITKLTEIGVKRIIPFASEYSIAKPLDKTERYLTIAREACKQCRRTKIIDVGSPITFDNLLEQIKDYDKVIFASELEQSNNLSSVALNDAKKVAVIIGSEGGFSQAEASKIQEAGALSITLGPRILRAETAGLVVPTIVQYLLGEFDIKKQ